MSVAFFDEWSDLPYYFDLLIVKNLQIWSRSLLQLDYEFQLKSPAPTTIGSPSLIGKGRVPHIVLYVLFFIWIMYWNPKRMKYLIKKLWCHKKRF